jgi:nitrogen regulatory protein PII
LCQIGAIFADFFALFGLAALVRMNVSDMTAIEGRGAGNQEGYRERYRGLEFNVDTFVKTRVEIAVLDAQADEIVEEVRKAACTGKTGDGKIFVVPLEETVRVRTGETGETAI